MAPRENREGAACARHWHAGRSDGADSPPAPVVESRAGARPSSRTTDRGVLRRASRADGAGARPDHGPGSGCSRPVGIAPAAARGRWLIRCLSRAAAHLHARRQQRLRSLAGVAVAARIHCDAACLPQGSRAPDPLGDRRTWPRTVLADDGGCNRVPEFPASADATRALGGPRAATQLVGMATALWWTVGPLVRLRAVGAAHCTAG